MDSFINSAIQGFFLPLNSPFFGLAIIALGLWSAQSRGRGHPFEAGSGYIIGVFAGIFLRSLFSVFLPYTHIAQPLAAIVIGALMVLHLQLSVFFLLIGAAVVGLYHGNQLAGFSSGLWIGFVPISILLMVCSNFVGRILQDVGGRHSLRLLGVLLIAVAVLLWFY